MNITNRKEKNFRIIGKRDIVSFYKRAENGKM
jgi:hypothetical protein